MSRTRYEQRALLQVARQVWRHALSADYIVIACRLIDGPPNARELAKRVMSEKDLKVSHTPLRNSVVYKVVQARRRDAVRMMEKKGGLCVWGAC